MRNETPGDRMAVGSMDFFSPRIGVPDYTRNRQGIMIGMAAAPAPLFPGRQGTVALGTSFVSMPGMMPALLEIRLWNKSPNLVLDSTPNRIPARKR